MTAISTGRRNTLVKSQTESGYMNRQVSIIDYGSKRAIADLKGIAELSYLLINKHFTQHQVIQERFEFCNQIGNKIDLHLL